MRIPLFKIILLFAYSISALASDSLNVKSLGKKWQLEFIGSYNYNYRKTGEIKETLILQNDRDAINTYVDTGNIACYIKNVGILLARKIWKPFYFQFGVIYGRKGFMHTRQLERYDNGKGGFADIYINAIPEKMIIIPMKINFILPSLNQKLKFGAALGIDFNLEIRQFGNKESNYYFFHKSYLEEETSGFFGFSPVTKLPPNTKLLHKGNTMPFLQYNLALFMQVKFYKSLFASVKYNYISQLGYYETSDYDLVIPGVRNQFKYQIKPYIHSFGIGLGFEF